MNCPHCQNELPKDYDGRWCPTCGKDLPENYLVETIEQKPREKRLPSLCVILLLAFVPIAFGLFLLAGFPDSLYGNSDFIYLFSAIDALCSVGFAYQITRRRPQMKIIASLIFTIIFGAVLFAVNWATIVAIFIAFFFKGWRC